MTQTTQITTLDSVTPIEPGAQSTKRKRILIAESDGFTRMVLMLLFRMTGFGVDFTANGTIALNKLRRQTPDALLLELKLSGLSGLELIREARQNPQSRKLRIYVFTDVELMRRSIRKEVFMTVTRVFDKRSISREDLVKSIVAELTDAGKRPQARPVPKPQTAPAPQLLLPEEVGEIIDGVSAQTGAVLNAKSPQQALESCRELRGRVCSLGSCAEAGGLRNLARQAKTLEALLSQLGNARKPFAQCTLSTVTRAVEILGLLARNEPGPEENLTQYSAAIIDESPASSKSLSDGLNSVGIHPTEFGSASRALEYLESHPVDLVIANMPLPELHGLELDKIRQLPMHASISVIFVSESAVDAASQGPFARAPLVNRNPLLLMEIVMKSLNELQNKGLRPSLPRLDNSLPPPAAAHHGTPESEVRSLPNRETEFLSSAPTAQPADSFFQDPAHLPILPGADSPSADPPAVPLGSQAGGWVAEKAPENQEEKKILFVGQDAFALELDTHFYQAPPAGQGGDAVAEDQIEAAPTLSAVPTTEETPADPAMETAQPAIADSQDSAALDWDPVSTADAGDEGLAAPTGGTPEGVAAEASLDSGLTELPSAPAAEATPPISENQAGADGHLQALEGECAQLRQTVANHEKECEMLVNRMLASESELHDAQTQLNQREETIASLQQQLEELKQQPPSSNEGHVPPGGQEETPDLEQQFGHNVAALARVTADLARERGERQRSEERAAALNLRLQQLHADTARLLEAQRADQECVGQLEAQVRQRDEDLARLTADLEQQKADAELANEQLQKTKELNAQLQKDHSFFEAAHQSVNSTQKDLQSRLAALQESAAKLQRETAERQRLGTALEEAQRGLQAQTQKRETLESELQRTSQALREAEAKLQQESAERQRLKEALDSSDLQLGDRCQRAELEAGQLRSALQLEQLERQRLESELVRVRQMTLDGARGTRLLRNTLRKQVREPVDNLYRSTQSLLQLELGKDQKQIAETILQDVLLVHTRLQEPAVTPADAGNAAADPAQSASADNAVAVTPSPAPAATGQAPLPETI